MASGHAISIELPPELYEQLQKAASDSGRSLEDVLIEDLSLLSNTLPPGLTIDANFSDEKLWAIVHKQLSRILVERKNGLIAAGKAQKLTQNEQDELDYLLDLSDELVILRSKALLLLKERGHHIENYLDRER